MPLDVWKMRLKQTILQLVAAGGYDLERHTSGQRSYQLTRRLSLGQDPLRDARIILGRPARCVFDVGAHFGQTALSFADAFPKAVIYSFEPAPDSFARLEAIARGCPRIKPFQAALGEQEREAVFFVNKFSQTNSLLPTAAGAQEYLTSPDQMDLLATMPVRVLTLDDFCTENRVEQIDLLKIDTQGYELKVLEGAQGFMHRSVIPLVYLEVCFVNYYEGQPLFQDVYEYLYDRSYRLVGLYESGFRTHYYRVGGNALFVHEVAGGRDKRVAPSLGS